MPKVCIFSLCCNKAVCPTELCAKHGGGYRCSRGDCTKSSKKIHSCCLKHGGGRRCLFDGCSRGMQGPSGMCIRHGGGKFCSIPKCTKHARKKGFCTQHHSQASATAAAPLPLLCAVETCGEPATSELLPMCQYHVSIYDNDKLEYMCAEVLASMFKPTTSSPC